jgi:hypothetical protein
LTLGSCLQNDVHVTVVKLHRLLTLCVLLLLLLLLLLQLLARHLEQHDVPADALSFSKHAYWQDPTHLEPPDGPVHPKHQVGGCGCVWKGGCWFSSVTTLVACNSNMQSAQLQWQTMAVPQS